MTKYNLRSYSTLQKKTDELDATFDAIINRFIPPSYEGLISLIHKLPEFYCKQVKEMLKLPEQTRLNQIACITQLATELQTNYESQCSSDETQIALEKHFSKILLGALLYRFLRLQKEYQLDILGLSLSSSSSSSSSSLSWGLGSFFKKISAVTVSTVVGEASKHCALYKVLSNEFFKKMMDDASIFQCLFAYKQYMEQPNIIINYSYFSRNSEEFMLNLDNILTPYKEPAKPVLTQLNYIANIVSLKNELRRCELELKKAIKSAHVDSSGCWVLTPSSSSLAIGFIEKYLAKGLVINQESRSEFTNDMDTRIDIYCQYALQAIYYLTLAANNDRPDLVRVINNLIKIPSEPNDLEYHQARKLTFKALTAILEYFTDFSFSPKPDTWDSFADFKALLLRERMNAKEVYRALERESYQESSSSSSNSP